MAYTHPGADGCPYYLHGKTAPGPGGLPAPVYWFARRPRRGATLDAVPAGWRVTVSAVTGRPYLRKAPPGENAPGRR